MGELIGAWKQKKTSAKKQNKQLVKKLRQYKGKKLDQLANEQHDEVFEKVDCLECANCCKSIPPLVNKTDIARMAKALGMSTQAIEKEYLTTDEDGDVVMNQSPCHFLQEDNTCFIYEARPKACRQYPHTDSYEFSQNLHLHAPNAMYRPAVFHILEAVSEKLIIGR